MRESRKKKKLQAQEYNHSVTCLERKKKKKKRIPNETIRLEIDSEKDLDCMRILFLSLAFPDDY